MITIASEISSSYGKRPICVCVTKETIIITKMAFTGTYKLQKTEFYNEYLKALSKLKLISFRLVLGYKVVFYISYVLMIDVSESVNFTYISLQIILQKRKL